MPGEVTGEEDTVIDFDLIKIRLGREAAALVAEAAGPVDGLFRIETAGAKCACGGIADRKEAGEDEGVGVGIGARAVEP